MARREYSGLHRRRNKKGALHFAAPSFSRSPLFDLQNQKPDTKPVGEECGVGAKQPSHSLAQTKTED